MTQTDQAAGAKAYGASRLLLGVLAVAVLAAAVVLLIMRMRYGADISDESYYSVIPYSFTIGHRPFIDEHQVYQLMALLTWPLVKAWVSVVGSSAGIVLFFRRMWLVLVLCVGAASFATMRKMVRWELALLVALLPVAIVPFNIQSLSYNTLSSQFVVLGVALGARSVVLKDDRWWWLAAAGAAHALAGVAYLTLSTSIVFFSIAILVVYRRGALRPLLTYWAGAAVVALAMLGVFAYFGFGNVRDMFAYQLSMPRFLGGGAKLAMIARQAVKAARPYRLLAAVLVVLGVALAVPRVGDRARWFLPLALPFLAYGFIITPGARGLILTVLFGLFATLWYLSARHDEHAWRWWVWAGLTPIATGFVTSYTSANGLMNMGVGMAATLLGSGLLFVLATSKDSELRAVWAGVGLAFVIGVAIWYQWNGNAVNHDVPVAQAVVRIAEGPYAGLDTSPWRAQAIAEMKRDIEQYRRPGDRLFSFTGQSWAYLFSDMRPATNNLWFSPQEDETRFIQTSLLDYWKRTGNYPTLVFRHVDPKGYAKGDLVTKWVEDNCTLVAEHTYWTIWRRK